MLEGMKVWIKVIKRMAYGFRDNGYFFVKSTPLFRHPALDHKKSPQ
ncbi:MAG: hypothetical protein ACJAS0_002062 [Alcanivorax borkumensis]|jgi:hypothetical protein